MMKSTKIKILTISVGALSVGSVQAQSSVTLYGALDAGFTYTSSVKGSSLFALTSSNEAGSRWGVTGTEDLGGNLKAIFTMEGGFSTTTGTIGTNGTLFGRQAFVGLASNEFGTATLGRQYSASYTAITQILALPAGGTWAAAGGGYGTHASDADNLNSANRINNAVKYRSPNWGGVTVVGLYSFGGKAGDFTQNSIYDIGVAYDNGTFRFGAGYLFAKNPNFSFWGDKANDSPTGNNMPNVIISGYASAGSEQIIGAGAGYTLGNAIFGLIYSNVRFNNLGSISGVTTGPAAGYRGSATLNTGEVNAKYQITPALALGIAYSYTKDSGGGDSGGAAYQSVDAGAVYSLSKATSVYAVGVYQRASGTNSLGQKAVAAIFGSAGPSSNNHQLLLTTGLLHKF